jgi:hypothetical protein
MKMILSIMLFGSMVFFSACYSKTVKHQPVRAANDANRVLRAVYIDGDYQKALELADASMQRSVKVDDLIQLTELIRQQRGKLKTLKADSYIMMSGNTMELIYVGEYELGIFYHRVVMVGDATNGYKVSGLWCRPDAYPDDPMRRKFVQEILVR